MKIAFIVNVFPSLSETFILNQITGLIDKGHKVDIFAKSLGYTHQLHEDVNRYNLLERTIYYNSIPKNKFYRVFKCLSYLIKFIPKKPLAILRSLNVFKY